MIKVGEDSFSSNIDKFHGLNKKKEKEKKITSQ
jgi:hypothetical protein